MNGRRRGVLRRLAAFAIGAACTVSTRLADPVPGTGGARYRVEGGGAWDDTGCGVCRPAAGHARPANLKHIVIGFRLVRDLN
jgi:formylglycine-generating enzyme required for sulfatase activity